MSALRNPQAPTGMTPSEREIMALWDAGKTLYQIKRRFVRRYKPAYIESVVNNYHGDCRLRTERNIRTATRKLLTAIAAVHPERVAA